MAYDYDLFVIGAGSGGVPPEPAAFLDRNIEEGEQGLARAEQPEGEREGQEQDVARLLPEPQEEQAGHEVSGGATGSGMAAARGGRRRD